MNYKAFQSHKLFFYSMTVDIVLTNWTEVIKTQTRNLFNSETRSTHFPSSFVFQDGVACCVFISVRPFQELLQFICCIWEWTKPLQNAVWYLERKQQGWEGSWLEKLWNVHGETSSDAPNMTTHHWQHTTHFILGQKCLYSFTRKLVNTILFC